MIFAQFEKTEYLGSADKDVLVEKQQKFMYIFLEYKTKMQISRKLIKPLYLPRLIGHSVLCFIDVFCVITGGPIERSKYPFLDGILGGHLGFFDCKIERPE